MLLDRQAAYTGTVFRMNIGQWFKNKLDDCKDKAGTARNQLADIGIPDQELYHQWDLRRKDQTSLRRRMCQCFYFDSNADLIA